MKTCNRFEEEGLLQLARGDSLDPHFESCPDCHQARLEYEQLKGAITNLHGSSEPASGWQERIIEELTVAPSSAHPDLPRRWPWLAGLAAGVAAVSVTLLMPREQSRGELSLSWSIAGSSTVYRGEAAKLGDVLQIAADNIAEDRYAEIRLYREGHELVFSCSDQKPCTRTGSTITANWSLAANGDYRAVVISSLSSPSPPGKGLDQDVFAVREAGGEALVGQTIEVR